MRKISIEAAKEGMELARPVYSIDGQIIINKGIKLKPRYIDNLMMKNIPSVYVRDERIDDVKEEEVIAERTKQEARSVLKNIFTETKQSNTGFRSIVKLERQVMDTVNNIVNDIMENRDVMINLADIKITNNYYFDHSITVSVLSIITAMKMDIPLTMIKRNTPELMLFDIGNQKIAQNILSKKDKLSENEFNEIKKHPILGNQIFKKTNLNTDTNGAIISQHHERVDGSGYPYGLKQKDLHILSQILAVADVYDALISDRPYRKAYPPHEALDILSGRGNEGLNVDIVTKLFRFVAAYPVGAKVMLSNEQSGLVVGNTMGYPFRPKVRIFYEGSEQTPLSSPYEIDLAEKSLNIVVTGVMKDE